jgi:ubiquinone/menaquinone biosynthesis C-methylase UbiE
MAILSPLRQVLKRFHPEGIPWPGTVFYNAMSETTIFQRHYELLARDIATYCPEGSILDIGTGPGWLLMKLHQLYPKLRLVGLDASPAMITRARRNLAKAGLSHVIDVSEGYADHMPFADGSFDTIVSTGSIHHWKDPAHGLNEVCRVLKHNGYALMYDLVSDTPESVLKETAREFGKLKMILLWLHAFEEPFYSCQGLESLAELSLFKQGRTRFVGVTCCLILKKE